MKVRKTILMLTMSLCIFSFKSSSQQIDDPKKIEKVISKVIALTLAATVKISPYDSVRMKALPGSFSGVAVSKKGHVLTAAHAIKVNQHYLVNFPDGTEFVAKSQGRVSIKNDSLALDLGLIKIQDKGNWSFVEMGDSETMIENELCLSISYPESFSGKLPNVRLGRLTDIKYKDGNIISTCKMEPGDSGGALFNSEGKLIGLHSFIRVSEEDNFEIPIYFYKKYWSALNTTAEYKQIPPADNMPPIATSSSNISITPIQSLLKVTPRLAENAISIVSTLSGKQQAAIGTVISFVGGAKSKSYVISKSSLVGIQPMVRIGNDNVLAEIVGRQNDKDLVLLEIPKPQLKGIVLGDRDSVHMSAIKPGKLLVSSLGGEKQYVSVLSTGLMSIARSPGFFGANAKFIDQKITITQILPFSGAAGVLKLNDWITGINGKAINQPAQFGEQVSKYFSGDTITVELIREGKEIQVKSALKWYESNHPGYKYAGGRSLRSDGFQNVLVHDGAIKADECGGPVFDSENRFYGINIARHSRTSTILMPANQILEFINKAIKKEL